MLKRLDGKPISGRLVYRSSDRSFDTELRPQGSFSSLLVNDVQIEVDEDGRLIYVWGYCPHESWTPARFDPSAAKLGLLQYVSWGIGGRSVEATECQQSLACQLRPIIAVAMHRR